MQSQLLSENPQCVKPPSFSFRNHDLGSVSFPLWALSSLGLCLQSSARQKQCWGLPALVSLLV